MALSVDDEQTSVGPVDKVRLPLGATRRLMPKDVVGLVICLKNQS